jgi:hypothetical protein
MTSKSIIPAAATLLNQNTRAGKSPSPPFRGEREGPVAQRREGEVGDTADRLGSPLTLPSPPAGGGKG